METELAAGVYVPPGLAKTLVAEWWDLWIAGQAHQKPKTLEGYRGLWRSRLEPTWGSRAIGSIRPLDVQAWVNRMAAEGLSHSRIRQAHLLLSQMMEAAVDNGMIHRNPVQALRLTRVERGKVDHYQQALIPDEVSALVAAAREEREADGVLVLFMVASGLRFGEIRGLRRGRVHLMDVLPYPHIEVREAVTDVGSVPTWGTPKSHQVRTVYLPPSVAAVLQNHLDALPEDPDGLVFTSPKGKMLDPNNFRNGPFQRWKKKAELPEGLRPHDLRHTCGSLMANAGVPLIQVKEHLGHSTVAVTEKYLHSQPFGDRPPVGSLKEWLEADVFQNCWNVAESGKRVDSTDPQTSNPERHSNRPPAGGQLLGGSAPSIKEEADSGLG